MIAIILAIIGEAFSVVGAVARGVVAYQRVDELLAEIDSATADLNISLTGVEADRVREIAQADETLERERTRILAQETEVARQLAADLERRLREHGETEEEIARQLGNLETNRLAAIAAAERGKEQALESRELTVTNLRERIAAGDIEAQRKVGQIAASRDLFLSQTRDEAIVVLNKHAGDAVYAITTAGTKERIEVGQVSARIASSAVRKTGTPLLALLQVETQARADYQQTMREAQFGTESTALGYQQKVVGARTQAEQNIEDVMAENAMADSQMEDQIEAAQLDFTHTYANLQASEEDINRLAEQNTAAQQARARSEDADYAEDVEQLNRDAADATAALEADLQAAIEANAQRKEDVTAQADVLTAHYRQQLSDLASKKTSLAANRASIVLTAALGGVSQILTSAESLVSSVQNYSGQLRTDVTKGT